MEISNLVDLPTIMSHATDLTLLVIGVFFAAFSKRIKEWLEKKTNDKFERSINKTSLVRDNLAELRALYQADRVLLFQLHNGQYYFSGEGADKLSLTHFVVDSGVAVPDRAGTRLQNIPVTYWPETFKVMAERGYFCSNSDAFHDPFMAQMLAVDGVHFVICGPIKDRRGFWRGVLIVSFMNASKPTDFCKLAPCNGDSSKCVAAEYGQKLGDLLSL